MDESAQPLALVVEDEELLRLHAAGLLEEHGFSVVEAGNADAALKILETRNDVRLLFTDIQMPGALDGMDLVKQVHDRWPDVLLVITSGRHLIGSEPSSISMAESQRAFCRKETRTP